MVTAGSVEVEGIGRCLGVRPIALPKRYGGQQVTTTLLGSGYESRPIDGRPEGTEVVQNAGFGLAVCGAGQGQSRRV